MGLQIDLSGKSAFITGVSSGIGLGIARQMAKAGCNISGCGTSSPDKPGPQKFIQEVQSQGKRAEYFQVDISSPRGPNQWIQKSIQSLGGVDYVISNAGRNVFKGIQDCNEKDWEECMQLDLASHWRLAKESKAYLNKSKNPVMIIISSNHAGATIPGCFPYNIAKAGLNAMVQSIAIEWGPKIRCVGIAPGFIDTPGNDQWFQSFPDPDAERKRTEMFHPVGRIGTVDEIGALCAFLSSDYAAFISGNTLLVDGGRSALMQDG